MTRAFFQATNDFHDRHTAALDFLHAASAALWNTRWQVNGYVGAVPDAHSSDLDARFVRGSGVRVNVRRSFVETTWKSHQRELAALALINSLALFEGWAEGIADRTGLAFAKRNLQFPTQTSAKGESEGVAEVIRRVRDSGESDAMERAFGDLLRKEQHHRHEQLEQLLTIYRYFKEVRNALVHSGGSAAQRLLEAYDDAKVITAPSLRMREVPEMSEPVLGAIVDLSLRGVIGLTAVAYSIVRTVDAELVGTVAGENEFLERFAARHDLAYLPHRSPAREQKLRKLIFQAGMPRPAQVDGLDALLKRRSLTRMI
jgi:hypothetical protein